MRAPGDVRVECRLERDADTGKWSGEGWAYWREPGHGEWVLDVASTETAYATRLEAARAVFALLEEWLAAHPESPPGEQ